MLWHLLNIIMVLPVLWVFLNCLPCSADGTSRLRILAINCAYHQEEMKNFTFYLFHESVRLLSIIPQLKELCTLSLSIGVIFVFWEIILFRYFKPWIKLILLWWISFCYITNRLFLMLCWASNGCSWVNNKRGLDILSILFLML